MFSYNEENPDIIISCTFDGVKVEEIDVNDVFREGSIWADRKLLYETIKAYAALSGWKPTLESRTCIKCSCFTKIRRKNRSPREYANGSLSKDCKWQVRIRSTKNISRKVLSGALEGKYKSTPLVDDGISTLISTADCHHTGNCNPSAQQQIIQRARSGEYVKCIRDASLYTLCTIYKEKMSIKSYYIKSIL